MNDLEEQIVDLQTRLAYQEDTLLKLNDVMAQQQDQLDRVSQALRSLSQQLRDWREQSGGAEPPPPHY